MNTGDIAWILLASALVLLMTPGLALFYGGLARSKNAAGTIMHSFMCMGIVGVVWVLWGYTLAFGPDVGNFIGDFSYLGLSGVSATEPGPYADNMPHQAFMIFQGMFAIITPALVTGAFAERMKFSILCHLHRPVGDGRVRSGRPLGMGRRLAWRAWRARLRGRQRSSHQLGCCRTGRSGCLRQTARIRV